MVNKYSYKLDGIKMVSPHFAVKEFASIGDNGRLYSDNILIDSEIVDILEKLYQRLGCYMLIINSGYRTNEHEKSLSNSVLNGYHTQGRAVDFNAYKSKTELYTAKEICLALEDLGWNKGIGLISNTGVHIDSRDKKYYFDERNSNRSIGDSFYIYYNEVKNQKYYDAIDRVADKYKINKEWWKEHFEDDFGKNAIKDLFLKIASNI